MPDIARPLAERTLPVTESVSPLSEAIEHVQENTREQEIRQVEYTPAVQEAPSTAVAAVASGTTALVSTTKTPLRRNIEKILEEDLRFLYLELPQERKLIFRQQGELTASRVEYLLAHAKINIDYLVYLVRRWLLLIPGVNRYFLEQESKIKAEKILFLNAKE